MAYVKAPKVFEKLKKAEEFYSPVIMTAPYGWGKSAAARYYYRRKSPLTITCERNGRLEKTPPLNSIRQNVVIIEDMHWLSEEADIQWLKELLHKKGRQVVMLTRGGTIPKYLAPEDVELDFVRIQEKDFALGEREIEAWFRERGIAIYPEDIAPLATISRGYPPALHYYAAHLENGERVLEVRGESIWQDIFHLWDAHVFDQWDPDFVRFALAICPFEEFTIDMAKLLTGCSNTGQIIEYCRNSMSQISYIEEGRYSLRYEVRRFYLWKRGLTWSKQESEDNLCKAAFYYEQHGQFGEALRYYKEAGAGDRIKAILIRNAQRAPGNAHYAETKEYYLELSEEEIQENPLLMAGMSMLYSLLLQPEQSEKWYEKLAAFAEDRVHSRESRREAKIRIAWLDIALPHRGTHGILRILRNAFTLMTKNNIRLPEFSVTGNMPSLMNGGLDFCEWVKSDVQIARFMGGPLEIILGKGGKGLVTIALAESGFEKGTMSAYEVMTRSMDGFEAAAGAGSLETCFAAVGIQVRQHILEGQYPSAKRLLDSFREKVKKEGAKQLAPNLEAFSVALNLFPGVNGVTSEAAAFIEKTADARISFSILERYRQMVKLRCFIAENRLQEGIELAGFLTGYFTSYERHFLWMKNEVLKAIMLFRMGDAHWMEHLNAALEKAEEYHFVRLFALEGAALLPLLIQLEKQKAVPPHMGEGGYLAQILFECRKVAQAFPDYLRYTPRKTVLLTKRESEVLSMLCAGMTTEDICRELGISYDGLKKHNRNIYRKLEAKDRAEAERKAIRLGLVHRGTD